MKASPQVVKSAMQLYFTGESFRNVQNFLRLQGVKDSHVSVCKWINKYVGLMNEYLEKIKPKVSDTWRADELWVKVNGDMKYVFTLMDDKTSKCTPILKGYQLIHNYIRPHEALGGKTPAEACGIEVKGENKWLKLIQNASRT